MAEFFDLNKLFSQHQPTYIPLISSTDDMLGMEPSPAPSPWGKMMMPVIKEASKKVVKGSLKKKLFGNEALPDSVLEDAEFAKAKLMALKVKRRHLLRKMFHEAMAEHGGVLGHEASKGFMDSFDKAKEGSPGFISCILDTSPPQGITFPDHAKAIGDKIKEFAAQALVETDRNPGVLVLACSAYWHSYLTAIGWEDKTLGNISGHKPLETSMVVIPCKVSLAWLLDRHPAIAKAKDVLAVLRMNSH